ncbi:GDSL-type esterase/lipase family protein [Bacillus wiedmannii]|uniref:GDSL-type esterase/lipase family protein n=1 Tax=Bacillus wiedmannii TaxID=1890302 RepID=UPI0015CF39AE|nr:GDSL-type esterase/lipase family protein [Bacillus wiedmannii]
MLKKIGICLFAGSIALTAAACENTKEVKKDVSSTTQNQEKKDNVSGQQTSYKSIFKDSLIMGDSIMEGLTYHDFLDKQNVMAKTGGTLMFVPQEKDDEEAIKRKPKHIFMAYGNDDLQIPADLNQKPVNDPVQFAMDNYKKIIGKMKKEVPDTKLHVLAILPVTEKAEQETPLYKKIKEYNEALKKLAETESIDYIDLSSLVKEHTNVYDKDGVHFKKEFYPLMLDALKPKLQ